ncbi:acyl-ACP--UDP-N-acetylglucosamine O-acyltransferase [Singulisphaera sp. PoT]|uniref:acyl-ACP--UDP-N-acetylglucosamine O-acyltransferase n=1 Tax=Singulisphaera sp. PoT TaxID=3411797 RepID=UPI003BF5A6D3
MASSVSETASVDPRARIADDVFIGPFCVVGPDVSIGRGTRLSSHIWIMGSVTLGEFNDIGPFVAIGGDPQDTSYRGTATKIEIGDHNTIHQRVTIHLASEKEDGVTRIGSHNTLLTGAHIAHDCKLGDGITIGSNALLAGHVHIEDGAYLEEAVAVLPFVTIGGSSYVDGQSKVNQDVPPYLSVGGIPASVLGINDRAHEPEPRDPEVDQALIQAYQLLFLERMPIGLAVEVLESHDQLTPEVLYLIKFVESQREGKRGRGRDLR